MNKPPQRPEGRLIEKQLAARSMAKRELARAVGISEARIRQIINGYSSAGRGQFVDVVAPAATLGEIAFELVITADELRQAGRDDAAQKLVEITERENKRAEDIVRTLRNEMTVPISDMSDEELAEALASLTGELQRRMKQGPGRLDQVEREQENPA